MSDGIGAAAPSHDSISAAAVEVATLLGYADHLPAFAAASAGDGDLVEVMGLIVRSIAADVFDIEPGTGRLGPAVSLYLSKP